MKTQKITLSILILFVMYLRVQAQYVHSSNFSEEAFIASLNITPKTILKSGATVISSYEEGVAITKLHNKFGLADTTGLEFCLPVYDAIRLYKNGYASIKKNNQWMLINNRGVKLTAVTSKMENGELKMGAETAVFE